MSEISENKTFDAVPTTVKENEAPFRLIIAMADVRDSLVVFFCLDFHSQMVRTSDRGGSDLGPWS